MSRMNGTDGLDSRDAIRGSHAVVLGGSMAGLLAARVLANHFDRVTVVERDRFPEQPAFRSGVPQSRHLHVLLVQGRVVLEQLFPGLEAELFAAGAVQVRWPADVLALTAFGWLRRFPEGLTVVSCSRELLEWHVRQRVAATGRVRFLQDHDATGVLPSADNTAVLGVLVRPRSRGPGAGSAGSANGAAHARGLRADLVVDASGRDSRAPQWLEAMGFAPPPATEINPFVGYASRYYAQPKGFGADWQGVYLLATPARPRGGALFPIEGDRWHVGLVGYGRDYPPTDEAGFLEFARSLRSPVLYEAIKAAEPLSPVRGYQRTGNLLRHYERLRRWPERVVALGDAVSAFNPVYGQGMTVAAQAAVVLDRCLRERRRDGTKAAGTGLGRGFQRRLAKANAAAWLLATGEDLRYRTTGGARPGPVTRLLHRYLDRVIAASTVDLEASLAFADVAHLLAPPAVLFRPRVAIPALRGTRPAGAAELDAPPAAMRDGPPAIGRTAGPTGQPTAAAAATALAAAQPGSGGRRSDGGGEHGLVHRYADLGDVRLHFVEAGAGGDGVDRPLVVLLHGFPEFWYSWRHQIPALAAAGFRVVAPDLRGYNLSGKPRGVERYRIDLLALDVERLIRRCGAARAVVAGNDWGGAVAWTFAMRYPQMVERLVVANAPHPARFFRALRTARQLRKSWYMFFFQLPWLPEAWLRAGHYAALRQSFRSAEIRPGAFTAADVDRYVEAIARPGALTAAINYYRALFRQNPRRVQASLRRIEAPVLVIWGERDRYLGAELAEPEGEWVPNARVERLPRASHWVQLDEPERFNSLLLEFLADVTPAPPLVEGAAG